MKSRWHRGNGDSQHVPVEMRFIDMFMTALGALVFVALLLVFLLPKTTQPKAPPAPQQPTAPSGRPKTEDKDIVKRGFGVLLLASGCNSTEPELYVRYEGKVVHFTTEEAQGETLPFDASNVANKS